MKRSVDHTAGPRMPTPHLASGEELDAWGAAYGVDRQGQDDDAYRARVLAEFDLRPRKEA